MTAVHDWRGRVGDAWAQEHARTERALAGVAAVLNAAIDAVAPDRGHAVDIGCGAGGTALALAAVRPGLCVTGVDLSEPLLAVARARAGSAGPRFVAGDVVDVLPGLAPLDLLVSRHGVMFFPDPRAGFAAMRAGAAPGAPLVFSCFRARADNDWATTIDALVGNAPAPTGYLPGPFGLADAAFTASLLAAAGWRDVRIMPHDVDYVAGDGPDPVAAALAFYRRIGPAASVLAAAAPEERARIEARLRDLFASRIRNGAVTFTAAIWIVAARAGEELP